MLHVSDLMREMKCDCFCWNSAHNSLHQESFYKMDCPFSDLWRNYLNANECGLGHSMDSNEQSLKLLEENDGRMLICGDEMSAYDLEYVSDELSALKLLSI